MTTPMAEPRPYWLDAKAFWYAYTLSTRFWPAMPPPFVMT